MAPSGRLTKLIVAFICLALTGAWPNSGHIYPKGKASGGAPAAYTGPGDVVSGAIVWYSCFRGYNNAYATSGTKTSCNIIRASDSHTCDTLIQTNGSWGNTTNCSTGGDNGQTASAFCNATTCKVTALYDQSGASNCGAPCTVVQATSGNQPNLVFSGCRQNYNPCVQDGFVESTATIASGFAQPVSTSIVFGSSSATNATMLATSTSGDIIMGYQAGPAKACYYAGGTNTCLSGSMFNTFTLGAINTLVNGSSSTINVNGSENTPASAGGGGVSTSTKVFIGNDPFSDTSVGDYMEEGYWNTGFTGTQRTNLCKNQQAFYGGSGSFAQAC